MGTVHCFPFLSFILNTSTLLLLSLYEGSWALLSSVAAFNAVGELSLLGRSGTVAFLTFLSQKAMVSGSALQLKRAIAS